jgi:hypothetical protein
LIGKQFTPRQAPRQASAGVPRTICLRANCTEPERRGSQERYPAFENHVIS